MKTIGLIGGMSWESSLEYYRYINEAVKTRLGGLHSAKCLLYSLDFAEVEAYQASGQWEDAARLLSAAAQGLERLGADCLVLCTNTMHIVADAIQASVSIPMLHIADATGSRIRAAGLRSVGLLGTRFTMEEAFYKDRLVERFGLAVLTPDAAGRREVDRVIYEELVLGKIEAASRKRYLEIVEGLAAAGAQGVILGCTEIGLLVQQGDSRIPLFDTARLHAEAAVEFADSG
jgi:aspartate racemase